MKIITDSDFSIPVKLFYNNVPLLIQECSTLSLTIYTDNLDASTQYSISDVDASGYINVDHNDVNSFGNGVLYYTYSGITTKGEDFGGVYQTEYYIMNVPEKHKGTCATAVSELIDDIGIATRVWCRTHINAGTFTIWQGTQEEFDAIPVKDPSTIYLIEVEL